jgi:hypothetical protein
MCGAGKAERAERSGLPRFFFGYFLCSNDKESNNKKINDYECNLEVGTLLITEYFKN